MALAALFDRLSAGGRAEEVGGLSDCFAGVTDPRSRRGVRHSIATIPALCAVASLSGRKDTVEITTWVAHAERDLSAALECRRDGTGRCVGPLPDTVDRVLGRLDTQAVATRVGAHPGRRAGSARSPRRSPPRRRPSTARRCGAMRGAVGADGQIPYLLAAATHDKATVIAERLIGPKTNDLPEFQPLLRRLPVGDRVLTMDATHTVRAHAEFIATELLAHFVMIVKKEAEGPLRASRHPGLDWASVPITHRSVDVGHGRREVRTIQVLDASADLGFPHLAQVFPIERYTTRTVRKRTKGSRKLQDRPGQDRHRRPRCHQPLGARPPRAPGRLRPRALVHREQDSLGCVMSRSVRTPSRSVPAPDHESWRRSVTW